MFWRPKPGSMRSTFHPILTPVWKSTKDQRLEWRKMPSMAFTSNHLVRFECFRLFSTTMGFSVNHIVLTSFKHICLFRYYINLIELFMWQGPRASRRCPAASWAKKGSIYELPPQRSSYLWHTCLRYQCWRHQVSDIFSFYYFSSWLNWWMHNIDCAKSARICSTLVWFFSSQPFLSPLDSYFNRERVSLEEIHEKYGHNGQVSDLQITDFIFQKYGQNGSWGDLIFSGVWGWMLLARNRKPRATKQESGELEFVASRITSNWFLKKSSLCQFHQVERKTWSGETNAAACHFPWGWGRRGRLPNAPAGQ